MGATSFFVQLSKDHAVMFQFAKGEKGSGHGRVAQYVSLSFEGAVLLISISGDLSHLHVFIVDEWVCSCGCVEMCLLDAQRRMCVCMCAMSGSK